MKQMMDSAVKELEGLWTISSHAEGSEKVKWLLAEISLKKCVELGVEKSSFFPVAEAHGAWGKSGGKLWLKSSVGSDT